MEYKETAEIQKYNIDSAWESFLEEGNIDEIDTISENNNLDLNKNIPKGNEIYISTKTKIAYLSHPINLSDTFWKINITPYYIPKEGVIKKTNEI